MKEQEIHNVMQSYLDNQEMSGGALIVRKNDEIVFSGKWGYADIESKTKITDQSIYRMMSMTKCVVGVAVMRLIEQGKIGLDDPVSKYIPDFANLEVANDPRYQVNMDENPDMKKVMLKLLPKLPFFRVDKVKTIPAQREITIRDLLSHASGLEQGWVGFLTMLKDKKRYSNLEERMDELQNYVLGFQPGTDTGYSPTAGFDVLTRILEVVIGKNADQCLKEYVFDPLEMKDASFWLNEEQKKRLVTLYRRKGNKLTKATSRKDKMENILHSGEEYVSGSGGLYCTLKDYENLARMLCSEGIYKGKQVLKAETVRLMHTEAQPMHLEPEPGYVWGLSVKIRQDPAKGNSFATAGTYGWSGAFGTHFFVSPADNLEAVFATNRSDLGGSASYISKKVEELVFSTYADK